ncbi:nucleotidyltransferase family protein [Acutalibacter sp. 1XD8-36]|uniref:nucleotidyltransferase family protein n=1 Tax=Acutalibacter sp. 1XD8-36 TaxID=2320852 RepID=UPI00262B9D6F|nr:nucleotidyltransferase domain-containing protein [Acutalibacter sp. 1XD8-36]
MKPVEIFLTLCYTERHWGVFAVTSKIYSIDEIKAKVAPIAEQYGVARVFLFGSYARGEAKPDSDLDFRIDKGSLRGLIQLGGLYSDLEETFDKNLDLLTTGSLEEKFLNRISNEEILIYGH